MDEGIRDLKCDSNQAYVRLKVYYNAGGYYETPQRYDTNSCDSAQTPYNGLSFSSGQNLSGAQVLICDTLNGCVAGNYMDNPYT